MLKELVGRLTYANVIATVALFVALGGGAYAVKSAKKNSVTSKSIKDNAVKSADVKDGGLMAKDFAADQPAPGTTIVARPHLTGEVSTELDHDTIERRFPVLRGSKRTGASAGSPASSRPIPTVLGECGTTRSRTTDG